MLAGELKLSSFRAQVPQSAQRGNQPLLEPYSAGLTEQLIVERDIAGSQFNGTIVIADRSLGIGKPG